MFQHKLAPVVFLILMPLAMGKPIDKVKEEEEHENGKKQQTKFIEIIQSTSNMIQHDPKMKTERDICALISNSTNFGRTIKDASYWAESSYVIVKHMLGALAVKNLKVTIKHKLEDIQKEIDNLDQSAIPMLCASEKNGLIISKIKQNSLRSNEVFGRIHVKLQNIFVSAKNDEAILQMLNQVNILAELIKQKMGTCKYKSPEIDDILDKIDDVLDKIADFVDRVCDYLEKLMDTIWDWLKDQPMDVIENIFCALHWLSNNVTVIGDGIIKIGDIILDWDDLVVICCMMG